MMKGFVELVPLEMSPAPSAAVTVKLPVLVDGLAALQV
jgi:hypothetical protein